MTRRDLGGEATLIPERDAGTNMNNKIMITLNHSWIEPEARAIIGSWNIDISDCRHSITDGVPIPVCSGSRAKDPYQRVVCLGYAATGIPGGFLPARERCL